MERLAIVGLFAGLILQPAWSQDFSGDQTPPADLESFFDGAMGALMEAHDVPGATLSVVKDGDILFLKGYGFADAQRTRPVDPSRTLFRPGSVSKLFTWTAVMQLVEQGRLDLDTDVNDYLTQFRIPNAFGSPITLRHIMTHTAGFEDGAIGFLFANDPEDLVLLEQSLEAHMPARVREPGEVAAYSNWATALAGLIVANIRDQDYEAAIEETILAPLGMSQSTFREPLPEALSLYMADGVRREKGVLTAKGFEYIANFGPAGALSTTAADMAHFMIAHLQDGEFRARRILRADTAQRMRTQLFTHDPRLPGMAYGFFESRRNGRALVGHAGDTLWFHSNMILFPEEGLGLFVSFNAPLGVLARTQLLNMFMDRFYPAPVPDAVAPPATFGDRAGEYAGAYRTNRRSYTRFEKILTLGGDVTLTPTEDDTLLVAGLSPSGSTFQIVEVDRDLFRRVDDETLFAFDRGIGGDVSRLYWGDVPVLTFDRLKWWETAMVHQAVLGAGIIIFMGTVLGTLWGLPKWWKMGWGEKLSRFAVFGASALYLAFFATLAVLLVPATQTLDIVFDWPQGIDIALMLPLAAAGLTAFSILMLIPAWIGGFWTFFGRVRHMVVVLALTAVSLSLYFWNAMGPWNL